MTQIGSGNYCWFSPFVTLCLQDAVKKCTRCPTKVTTEMLSTKGSEMLKNTTSEPFFHTLFYCPATYELFRTQSKSGRQLRATFPRGLRRLAFCDNYCKAWIRRGIPMREHVHLSSLFSSLNKVFTWKNKAGIEWELALTKVEKGGKVLVFKVSQPLKLKTCDMST